MGKIVVIYYSKTGNTEKMAELVAEGCRQVPGAEVTVMKLPPVDVQSVVDAEGYALGSPDYFSYMAGHMKTFFDEALAHKKAFSGKPYVAFGTHGGGAKVLDSMERLSQAVGLRQVRPGMLCQGAPGADDEDSVRELGRALGEAVSG